MGGYKIEIWWPVAEEWHMVRGSYRTNGLGGSFPDLPRARAAMAAWFDQHGRQNYRFRIVGVETGHVIWQDGHWRHEPGIRFENNNDDEKELIGMADVLAQVTPLNIPRTDLIAALQAKADEAKKERDDEQKKIDDAQKATKDAIKAFTVDELYQIFEQYFTVDTESLQKHKTSESFVPAPLLPTRVETDLERAVRVLGLANDVDVEVQPTSDLYRLL